MSVIQMAAATHVLNEPRSSLSLTGAGNPCETPLPDLTLEAWGSTHSRRSRAPFCEEDVHAAQLQRAGEHGGSGIPLGPEGSLV